MTLAAWAIEEWASALQATTQRAGAAAVRRSRAVWRAATSAERLPRVPPWTKTPPASAGKPGEVGDPAQRLVLGVDRAGALEPRAAVDRRGTHHEVEERGGLGRGGRDEGEVARVVDRDAGLAQHRVEQREGLLAAEAVLGDGLARGDLQLAQRARSVEGHRVEDQAPARVLQDRLAELLGLVVVAVHGVILGPLRDLGGSPRSTVEDDDLRDPVAGDLDLQMVGVGEQRRPRTRRPATPGRPTAGSAARPAVHPRPSRARPPAVRRSAAARTRREDLRPRRRRPGRRPACT